MSGWPIVDKHADPLTGLPHRQAFLAEVERLLSLGVTGSLVFAEIDHFKKLNLAYGHRVGDAVIRLIAERFAAALPAGSILSRVGGDEFYIFLPKLRLEEAHAAMTRQMVVVASPMSLRSVSAADIGVVDREIRVTLSVGIAYVDEHGMEAALRDSDMAWLAAKWGGGNRIVAIDEQIRRNAESSDGNVQSAGALARENYRLRDEARTDALTELRNFRALAEVEALRIAESNCKWRSAAVAFIDIDCFGKYNHRYGDQAGDSALRGVAGAILRAARESDLAYRKGGEEFVVVLPDVDVVGAAAVAERIRKSIEWLALPHEDSDVCGVVTATVGVCCGRAHDSIKELRAAAGDFVMTAKRNGLRNKVHTAGRLS